MESSPAENQYAIRLFRRDRDLPRLVQLRIEIEAFDQAGNDVSEAAAIETLNWPGHNPEQDRWIIELPGKQEKLIGHAWVRAQSQERTIIYMAIHPNWRRKGLGSSLLDCTLTRALEFGATHVTAGANVKNKEADAFLLRHGFRHAGDNRFMRAPAGIPISEPRWPDGYTVRNYAEVHDLPTLVEAFNRSYGDMWGHQENIKGAMNEDFLAEIMNKYPRRYNPEGVFIAFAPNGDIAGVCLAILSPKIEEQGNDQEKIIDSPGVAPEYRHLGLQHPLTLTAMHWLRGHGPGSISLESYGDGDDAVKIYHELGFALEEHYMEYCRYLS